MLLGPTARPIKGGQRADALRFGTALVHRTGGNINAPIASFAIQPQGTVQDTSVT